MTYTLDILHVLNPCFENFGYLVSLLVKRQMKPINNHHYIQTYLDCFNKAFPNCLMLKLSHVVLLNSFVKYPLQN
jgi:hypothetical protein